MTHINLKEIAMATAGTLAASLFIFMLLLNWITGCGEVFPTASGEYIQGECIGVFELFGGLSND